MVCLKPSSSNKPRNHITSLTAKPIDRYSASTDDRETVGWFLYLYGNSVGNRNTEWSKKELTCFYCGKKCHKQEYYFKKKRDQVADRS